MVRDETTEKKVKALMVRGPEVELSGDSAKGERYSHVPWESIRRDMESTAEALGMVVEYCLPDDEEAFIGCLRRAATGYQVLIIDPGQYVGATPAARKALSELGIPIIEVHPFNVFCDDLNGQSGIADLTTAHLAGFGKEGYAMAIRAANQMV
jgi:3-dehydroquinate dehydratase-2